MEIRPILSSLRHHKTAAGLIVLQIALTCAIVCNALFLISQRVQRIDTDSGMQEDEVVMLAMSTLAPQPDAQAQMRSDLAALRQIPGVRAAALASQIPWGMGMSISTISTQQGETNTRTQQAAHYIASEGLLATLGLQLVQGRDFRPEEFISSQALDDAPNTQVPAIIINQGLANLLFPGQSALGQQVTVYNGSPQRVVGVVAQLPTPSPRARDSAQEPAMILPVSPQGGVYLLRSDKLQREAVLQAARKVLLGNSPGLPRAVREQASLQELRQDFYRQDRAMAWLLGVVCLALLGVTAFGIVGLASFWVQQRSRMIGTRRALGATRADILRYFQLENLLLSTLGIALGLCGALGLSALLVQHYELPRLPLAYLGVAALLLWALGQLAVWAPARRASQLAPMQAMRGLA
ncbi:ABC transporter permease [Roseateles sp. BYS180W]|uniref:ABC transporter permease n=1 Tax=Roseateles rivi TaxID=3299028 RepID=A0ABW7FVG9_9BURK